MTITVKGIDREQPDNLDQKTDALHRFWTAAGDVFIKIARDQPDIQQLVYSVADAGSDLEITAHNREGEDFSNGGGTVGPYVRRLRRPLPVRNCVSSG